MSETNGAHAWGVGMPALLLLHEFGRMVRLAFGRYPELVGSALTERTPRDIDVRLVLPMREYLALIGPADEGGKPGTRWAVFAVAFSLLGKQMTGLNIDFQVQTSAIGQVYADEQRLPIGYGVGRFTTDEEVGE